MAKERRPLPKAFELWTKALGANVERSSPLVAERLNVMILILRNIISAILSASASSDNSYGRGESYLCNQRCWLQARCGS
jgi:hypothetical protein